VSADRKAVIVVDLAFGDCGKGTIVDFLVRDLAADLVVRFNGGPQAGHNVVTPDGRRHHTFSQFGSGTFVPAVRTLLSHRVLIEPYAMLREARHLAEVGVPDAFDRLFIDGRCTVITPAHQAANQIRELARGAAAHGTCGVGFGETVADSAAHPRGVLRARDLGDRVIVGRQLRSARERMLAALRDEVEAVKSHPRAGLAVRTLTDDSWVEAAIENYAEVARRACIIHDEYAVGRLLRESIATVYEGAQGVLLDQKHGFAPHTTWSDTTFANADELVGDSHSDVEPTRVGVLRTYSTRHGPGPFVTEDASLLPHLLEPHNGAAVAGGWQGAFRVGPFDAVAARYALKVCGGVDFLAVTHLDRLPSLPPHFCNSYYDVQHAKTIYNLPDDRRDLTSLVSRCRPLFTPLLDREPHGFLGMISKALIARVGLTSCGPTSLMKSSVLSL
jgi:adenylosuccinate synthase